MPNDFDKKDYTALPCAMSSPERTHAENGLNSTDDTTDILTRLNAILDNSSSDTSRNTTSDTSSLLQSSLSSERVMSLTDLLGLNMPRGSIFNSGMSSTTANQTPMTDDYLPDILPPSFLRTSLNPVWDGPDTTLQDSFCSLRGFQSPGRQNNDFLSSTCIDQHLRSGGFDDGRAFSQTTTSDLGSSTGTANVDSLYDLMSSYPVPTAQQALLSSSTSVTDRDLNMALANLRNLQSLQNMQNMQAMKNLQQMSNPWTTLTVAAAAAAMMNSTASSPNCNSIGAGAVGGMTTGSTSAFLRELQQQQQQQSSPSLQFTGSHQHGDLLRDTATGLINQPWLSATLGSQVGSLTNGTTATTQTPDSSSLDRAAKMYRNAASMFDATCTWSGQLPSRSHKNPSYSCKVFLGGVPWDITETSLINAFKQFGNVKVEWPGKDNTPNQPKGYVYVIFETEAQVKQLLQSCTHDFSNGGDWYFRISSKRMRSKEVQVIPWVISESNYVRCPAVKLDPQKTVFVGALHGMLNAEGLAHIMNDLFNGVVYAGIDTDKHKYPIGSARVTFNNEKSYMRAVTAAFIEIKTLKFSKKVQVDPYLEDSMCSHCNLQQGPYFCRDPTCFRYYCRSCWQWRHFPDAARNHKPLTKHSTKIQPNLKPLYSA